MGNDLISWRAAIGTFYCNTQPMMLGRVYRFKIPLLIEIGLTLYRVLSQHYNANIPRVNISIYIAVLLFLLILLGGDISENPGPEMAKESLSILDLNIRSIRNKISYIEDTFLDFNILCFTETI